MKADGTVPGGRENRILSRRSENRIHSVRRERLLHATAAFICTGALFLAVALLFGLRFDLNDDVMIRQIVSGAYTGEPEAHNIQMLYPLGLLLSLPYRLLPGDVDWYGFILEGIQFACMAVILYRILRLAETVREGGVCAAVFLLSASTLFFPHIVFCQYTVVCAVLSGTAAFLLLTGRGRRNDICALIILWVAFLVRSEMMLLTLPLVCVAALFRIWNRDGEHIPGRKRTDDIKKTATLLITLVIGMAMLLLWNHAAYGSAEWRTFNRLFDNRTELYDFYRIPSYENHEVFYESIGLRESEQQLLVNYNYGLDESINADTLAEIVDFIRNSDAPDLKRTVDIKTALQHYLYRLRNLRKPDDYRQPASDAPWNIITIMCYVFALVLSRKQDGIWKLLLLFLCRTVLWGYILMRGRDPVRITHGLYLVELLILFGFILDVMKKWKRPAGRKITRVMVALPILICLFYLPSLAAQTRAGVRDYAAEEERYETLYNYTEAHPDIFYFIDVYSWVACTGRIGTGTAMKPANSDICGGWVCKSPLYDKKLRVFGFDSMRGALLTEGVRFVQDTGKDTAWLAAFYADKGTPVTVTEEDRIASGFTVYRVQALRGN